jgi:hypothetical protein
MCTDTASDAVQPVQEEGWKAENPMENNSQKIGYVVVGLLCITKIAVGRTNCFESRGSGEPTWPLLHVQEGITW